MNALATPKKKCNIAPGRQANSSRAPKVDSSPKASRHSVRRPDLRSDPEMTVAVSGATEGPTAAPPHRQAQGGLRRMPEDRHVRRSQGAPLLRSLEPQGNPQRPGRGVPSESQSQRRDLVSRALARGVIETAGRVPAQNGVRQIRGRAVVRGASVCLRRSSAVAPRRIILHRFPVMPA